VAGTKVEISTGESGEQLVAHETFKHAVAPKATGLAESTAPSEMHRAKKLNESARL
jgi:hypothetical protein